MKYSCCARRGRRLLGATRGSPCRFCEARAGSVGSSKRMTPQVGSKFAVGRALGLGRVLALGLGLGLRGLSLMAIGLESGRGGAGGAGGGGGFFPVDTAFGPEDDDAASSQIAIAPAPGGAGGGLPSPPLVMSKGSGSFLTISTRCKPPCPFVLNGSRPKWYIC